MEIPSLIAFAVPGCRILDYTRRGGWWLVMDDDDNMSGDVPDVHTMLFQYISILDRMIWTRFFSFMVKFDGCRVSRGFDMFTFAWGTRYMIT